jgi:tripartite-type tricarboxylate transporter receptor subunit TctC
LFSGVNQTINPSMGPVPSFDLLKVLAPVTLVARVPYVFAANSHTPFNQLDQLVSMAKSSPGKFTVSSAQLDVYVELFKQRAGIDLLHVPYKGGAPATTDAISGQVDMVFALVPVLLPHIESGRLKAIGVTSTKRLPMLPNTSTLVEAGIDYDLSSWYGVLVPKATPAAIVERISQVTQNIAAMPSFVEKLRARGAVAEASSPSEFHKQVESELKFWAQIAQQMPKLAAERKAN